MDKNTHHSVVIKNTLKVNIFDLLLMAIKNNAFEDCRGEK
jgi:hypothetical protein